MGPKKRILLNWWYDRADLIAPFLQLADEIEFTCIFYKKPSGKEQGLPFRFLFWGDFSSPQQLLSQVQPDEVILFSIEDSPYQIALTIACQNRGICTTLIDHGLRGFGKINAPTFVLDAKKPQAVWFLLRAIPLSPVHLWPKIVALLAFKFCGSMAGRTHKSLAILRRASRYICYAQANASFFLQRDNVNPSQVHLIGNPGFDRFFSSKPTNAGAEPYFLLIDQPLARSNFNHALFTEAEKTEFLHKLNRYCLSAGHKLFIKLHPDEFGHPDLVVHENICYFRHTDSDKLIWQSNGVFGFYSTLLLPAIYAKRCILFGLGQMPLQQHWAGLGVVKLLGFHDFQPSDLDFETVQKSEWGLKEFVRLYLYQTDGKAFERLRNLLLPPQTGQKLA